MPSEVPEAGHVHSTDVFDRYPVRTPSTSISGRNEAGPTLVEVGATWRCATRRPTRGCLPALDQLLGFRRVRQLFEPFGDPLPYLLVLVVAVEGVGCVPELSELGC